MRGLEKRIDVQVPDRLPLVRAADPLSRGLAGRDAGHRLAADGGAGRRRRQPGGRRASTPTSRPSSTRPTATSPTTPARRSARRPTRSSSTAATGDRASAAPSTGPTRSPRAASCSRTPRPTSQAEFQKNLAFALDLAKSARGPRRARSRTWATPRRTSCRPRSRRPTATRRPSRSTPRSRSARSRRHWQRQRRPRARGPTSRVQGRRRATASPGTYYHHLRGQVSRHAAGRQRQGVVHRPAASAQSDPFTYTVKSEHRQQGAADGRPRTTPGRSRRRGAPTPARCTWTLPEGARATRASASTSTTSTPRAAPRRRRSACSRHYKAVVWETGDDLYVARARAARRHRHVEARSTTRSSTSATT